jgi:hypothetical protein
MGRLDKVPHRRVRRETARRGVACGAVLACLLATPAWGIGTGAAPPRVEGRARVLAPVRRTYIAAAATGRFDPRSGPRPSVDRPSTPATRRSIKPDTPAVIGHRDGGRRLRSPHGAGGFLLQARKRLPPAARSSYVAAAAPHVAASAAVFHDANAPPRRPSSFTDRRA